MRVDSLIRSVGGQVSLVDTQVYQRSYTCTNAELQVGDQSYTLRIIAIAVLFVTNQFFGALPWLCRALRLQTIFFYASTFAGGVILAAGLVHLLPEANAILQNPCLGLSGSFPWAFTICGGSLLISFGTAYFSRAFIRRIVSRKYDLGDDLSKVVMLSHDYSAFLEQGVSTSGTAELSIVQRAYVRDQKVASTMLEAGILIHAFFLGLNLGVTSASYFPSLLIALIFQQGLEGVALGATFVKAHFTTWKYFLLLGVFVLTTPGAIAIGIGLSKTYDKNGKMALGFQGSLNAISSGILLYHAIVDVLMPAFASSMLLSGPVSMRYVATLCLCAGFAVMASLVRWS